MTRTLGPSALWKLIHGCPRCAWLQFHRDIRAFDDSFTPRAANLADASAKAALVGHPIPLANREPLVGDRALITLESADFDLAPGFTLKFKGEADLLARRTDGQAVLLDVKFSLKSGEDLLQTYEPQLLAMAFALQQPATAQPIQIAEVGILRLFPQDAIACGEQLTLVLEMTASLVGHSPSRLAAVLQPLANIAQMKTPPPKTPKCGLCGYVKSRNDFMNSQRNKKQ